MTKDKGVITIPQGYAPRQYQEELFRAMDGGVRRAFLCWPRQVGKDTSCFAFMAKEAASKSGNYFYIFPTKEMARKAVWEKVLDEGTKLIEMLPSDPKLGLVKRLNNQEMVIELFNNSTIRLIGLDKDPDAGRGITPRGVVFSEFAFSDPQAYANVLPALRMKDAWCIINSTPNGRNHFYEMLMACRKDSNWFVSHKQGLWPDKSDYIHIHDKLYFETIINQGVMTWDDVEREYGCSFATSMKGSIYADLIERAWHEDRIGRFIYDDTKLVHTFWDLGLDDSTAIWFMQKIGNTFVFIDYFEESGEGVDFYVDKLKSLCYNYGTHYLPHDADHRIQGRVVSTVAQSLSESLREKDLSDDYIVLAKLGVQDGIQATRQKFSRCFFDSVKCSSGLQKLELYHRKFDKRRKIFIQDPVHDENSHAADALRMFGIHDDKGHDQFYHINQNQIKINTEYNLWGD